MAIIIENCQPDVDVKSSVRVLSYQSTGAIPQQEIVDLIGGYFESVCLDGGLPVGIESMFQTYNI